jgi:hypothetical protein
MPVTKSPATNCVKTRIYYRVITDLSFFHNHEF